MSPDNYLEITQAQALAWDAIMQDSNELFQLAHQKNWQQLLQLHEKRDARLRDFFDTELTQDMVSQVQKDLETIKSQDTEIVELVRKNQSELSVEARHLRLMKERIRNYVSAEKN